VPGSTTVGLGQARHCRVKRAGGRIDDRRDWLHETTGRELPAPRPARPGISRPHRPCCQRLWHVGVSSRLVLVAEWRRIQLFRLHRHAGATQQKAIGACPSYREEPPVLAHSTSQTTASQSAVLQLFLRSRPAAFQRRSPRIPRAKWCCSAVGSSPVTGSCCRSRRRSAEQPTNRCGSDAPALQEG
jgi:hypothetical protein